MSRTAKYIQIYLTETFLRQIMYANRFSCVTLITNINHLSFFVYKEFKSTHFNKFWQATGTVHCCCSVLPSHIVQGGSNMTGTDLCVNKPHCAAAVRP